MTSATDPSRSLALDGIRGIAILSVVIYHATMSIGHNFAPLQALLNVGHAGWLGVEVFFALSGFLITRILLSGRHQPAGRYFGTFYYRRALRIFPLYFGVLGLLWCLATFWPTLNAEGAARFLDAQAWFWLHGANLLREYAGPTVPALEFGQFELTHFWTLAVEEHFYFVWPWLVFVLPVRRLAAVAMALVLLSMALRSGWLLGEASPWVHALVATPKYLAGLAIGGLAAMWQHTAREHTPIDRVVRPALWVLPVLLLLCYLATPASARGAGFRSAVALIAALIAACAALAVTQQPDSRLARSLSHPVLITYGKYSYGIYVFHYLLGPLTRQADLATWPGGYTLGIVWYVSLYLLLPLGVAVLSYHLWEAPWLRLKSRGNGPVSGPALSPHP